jgi:hypothetical protein
LDMGSLLALALVGFGLAGPVAGQPPTLERARIKGSEGIKVTQSMSPGATALSIILEGASASSRAGEGHSQRLVVTLPVHAKAPGMAKIDLWGYLLTTNKDRAVCSISFNGKLVSTSTTSDNFVLSTTRRLIPGKRPLVLNAAIKCKARRGGDQAQAGIDSIEIALE